MCVIVVSIVPIQGLHWDNGKENGNFIVDHSGVCSKTSCITGFPILVKQKQREKNMGNEMEVSFTHRFLGIVLTWVVYWDCTDLGVYVPHDTGPITVI